nr:MAG TPA: hypothetical protein [Caudoviricetes sp.]
MFTKYMSNVEKMRNCMTLIRVRVCTYLYFKSAV